MQYIKILNNLFYLQKNLPISEVLLGFAKLRQFRKFRQVSPVSEVSPSFASFGKPKSKLKKRRNVSPITNWFRPKH